VRRDPITRRKCHGLDLIIDSYIVLLVEQMLNFKPQPLNFL
jgi:hypothetical protein